MELKDPSVPERDNQNDEIGVEDLMSGRDHLELFIENFLLYFIKLEFTDPRPDPVFAYRFYATTGTGDRM